MITHCTSCGIRALLPKVKLDCNGIVDGYDADPFTVARVGFPVVTSLVFLRDHLAVGIEFNKLCGPLYLLAVR